MIALLPSILSETEYWLLFSWLYYYCSHISPLYKLAWSCKIEDCKGKSLLAAALRVTSCILLATKTSTTHNSITYLTHISHALLVSSLTKYLQMSRSRLSDCFIRAGLLRQGLVCGINSSTF